MSSFLRSIDGTLWNVFHRIGVKDVIDIIIVAVILYQLYKLTRQTRASALLKGVAMLLLATLISNLFGLTALNWLLLTVINNGAIVLVILFQPELRKALEQIGRGTKIDLLKSARVESAETIISEIILCLTNLSRRRVGALIVFEQKTGLQDIVETGTTIDAVISAPLLENIFEPNTPLHDGAVIIRGTRVQAGACYLTLTEGRGVSRELGTRHRAAIGVSETTDAVVLIVSEETGIISMARGGRLTRYLDQKSLTTLLEGLFGSGGQNRLANLWQRVRRKEGSDT